MWKTLTGFLLLGSVLFLQIQKPTEFLTLKYFDYLMMSDPVKSDNRITLVEIDEATVEAFGGYPLPRDVYANLLQKSLVSGLTVFFPDADVHGKDEELAKALRSTNTILPFVASSKATGGGPHVGTATIGGDPHPWLYKYPGILRTPSILESSTKGIGLLTAIPDEDGLVRKMPLVLSVESKLYPSFGLEILRILQGAKSYQLKVGDSGIQALRVPPYTVPSDSRSNVYVDWNRKFNKVSALDYKEGMIAIIGVTAEGVATQIPTPAGLLYPHEVQAMTLSSMLDGETKTTPDWALGAELLTTLVAGIVLIFTSSLVFFSIPFLALILGGLFYASKTLFAQGLLLDVSFVTLGLLIIFLVMTFYNFAEQYFLRLRIKQQFGTYLSPDMVKKLQENPKLLSLGGVTKRLTFLFSDIRGFTPISEKYQSDPQGLTSLINRFLDNQTEIILKHGGTIDKYMGDCIMAFWGAPLDDEQQVENATKAIIEMRISLEKLNEELNKEGLDQINTGAGINTGLCVVGNFGSSSRFDYSVLGDSVNLAARLESQCKEYNVDVIISEHSLVDGYEYTYLDEIIVKGKSEPIKIYTLQK
jgi:adenylate cyclase